jgi:hypothetical protein
VRLRDTEEAGSPLNFALARGLSWSARKAVLPYTVDWLK